MGPTLSHYLPKMPQISLWPAKGLNYIVGIAIGVDLSRSTALKIRLYDFI